MPNILLIGAPGYIGRSLVHALSTSGLHTLFALARTPQKALLLRASEVHPIPASITDHALILNSITTHHISCIVDLSGTRESKDLLAALVNYAQQVSGTGNERVGGKLGYIYCSGTWVHGSSHEIVNDLMPVGVPSSPTPPADLVAWRADFEKEVLAAQHVLDVLIIRPALVYGRAGNIWDIYFEPLSAQAGKSREENNVIELPIEPDSRPGLIHVDDVAAGFACAIEKLPLLAGTGVYPVFDLVTSTESMRDVVEAAGRVMGVKGEIKLVGAGKGDDAKSIFERAMGTSYYGDVGRVRSLLGWEPRRLGGFVGGMKEFVGAWEAARIEG
jgi:nucleoside-diphosphate-sugar epimerase